MYLQHFGLAEAPFSITPDPAFVYLSQRHRDALAHLLYGVGQGGSGGFVQLTGEVGTGKTTLCRCLLEQVPENTRIALILNPLMTPRELLAAICEELGIPADDVADSNKQLVDRLTEFLLAAHARGERVVVVIDEAQNLSPDALEQVRLLTNLETSKQKLLQMVLLGQPELRQLLQRQSLRQLAQRVTARYHLTPLGPDDTAHYVRHRLQVAGAAHNPFNASALRALYHRSHGVPRLINIIADRALVAAYAGDRQNINGRLVHAAADEVQLGEPGARRATWPWYAAAGLLLAMLAWSSLRPGLQAPHEAVVGDTTREAEPISTQAEPAGISTAPEPAAEAAPLLEPGWLRVQDQVAFEGLAATWDEPGAGPAVSSACMSGYSDGWACLRLDGSSARIRQLGLPVVLQLSGPGAERLLLLGIDGERMLVGSPGTSRTVSRAELEARWFGSYMVAWPQAANWPREIARGDRGPAVETVIRLAALAEEPFTGRAEFGAEFERWLVAFQVRHDLEADGIVGPKTLLYLMRPSIRQPSLLAEWKDGV